MTNPVLADSLRPTRDRAVSIDGAELTLSERDRSRSFLLLHGGGGVVTMAGFADLLAERAHARVVLPTHPGFGGTARPNHLATTRDLAATYVALLDELDLLDVTVIGNSFGGWLALEMAMLKSPRVSGAIVLDAIGLVVDGHPLTSVAGLSPAELAALSFHHPERLPLPPARPGDASAGPSPDVQALIAYAGPTMSDPTLLDRLSDLTLPIHVVWGESDRIVDPAHGEALAAALPLSTFTLLPRTGHMPQFETPEELFGAIFDLGR